ncbi:S-adenosyl-L-methionine-dependent methyltransferase [Cylindrobasidium torrendii FP15055 ss-10]|uniref:S-adenosyl-L-methionine-dependent methyltransferase n=1 Tax=Cylindrobasidium torrendii FP15055 ss-10 TaxID=1314674 RepID=A0A0D7B591_9AGAR|nr:S-adenosyl-L-methionine-dependent methyltransferase [Cylindrobasidium torrendii FP15055 ss-10]
MDNKVTAPTSEPSELNIGEDLKALVASGYDKVAAQYLVWAGPRPTTTRSTFIEKLSSNLSPGARILELGCGAGVPSTQDLVRRGFSVTGVDISSAQITLAHEHVLPLAGKGQHVEFLVGDMAAMEFDVGSFAAVLAFYALFHLPMDEQPVMLEKMVSWIKPGGYLLANLHAEEGDVHRPEWIGGVPMFSSGLGVEGIRKVLNDLVLEGKLEVLEDIVDHEKVGSFEEPFHWVYARKPCAINSQLS